MFFSAIDEKRRKKQVTAFHGSTYTACWLCRKMTSPFFFFPMYKAQHGKRSTTMGIIPDSCEQLK